VIESEVEDRRDVWRGRVDPAGEPVELDHHALVEVVEHGGRARAAAGDEVDAVDARGGDTTTTMRGVFSVITASAGVSAITAAMAESRFNDLQVTVTTKRLRPTPTRRAHLSTRRALVACTSLGQEQPIRLLWWFDM
jgi:hypothetical protein